MFTQKPQKEYALIDAGNGFKLEKYGEYLIARPDPQALWPKAVFNDSTALVRINNENINLWPKIDAVFSKGGNGGGSGRGGSISDDDLEQGNWMKNRSIPDRWPIKFELGDELPPLNIYARLTPFKHTGIFPEQAVNWKWSMEIIKKAIESGENFTKENPPKVLNLFGYSGGATSACLLVGAHVTHVDSSKGAITWANENAELAGVLDKPVRWILEDAVSFIKKEIRRGNKYDGIILDPPAFGRGAKGEVWKIERDFLPFLEMIYELLSDKALFLILNGYAAGYSSIAYAQNLKLVVDKRGGVIDNGELCIEQDKNKFNEIFKDQTNGGSDTAPILLPCGITARWKRA